MGPLIRIEYTSTKLTRALEKELRSLWENVSNPQYFQNQPWDFAIILTCWENSIIFFFRKWSARIKNQLLAQESNHPLKYNTASQNHSGKACPELAWLSQLWPFSHDGTTNYSSLWNRSWRTNLEGETNPSCFKTKPKRNTQVKEEPS